MLMNLNLSRMEEKLKLRANMKKVSKSFLSYSSKLWGGILGLTLLFFASSCRDDLAQQPETQVQKNNENKVVNLDLEDIELDPEVAIQYASNSTQARGIEMVTPSSTDVAKGKLPYFGFKDTQQTEENFPVVLALVGYSQDVDCYARATWKIKKETDTSGKTRYFVRARGPITFDRAPDYSRLKEGETWYLHAIYAPKGTWNKATATWTYRAEKVITRLFNDGEKVSIGSDIDIPFVLGHNVDVTDKPSGWREGYTLVANRDNRTSSGWAFSKKQMTKNNANVQQGQKQPNANPRFKMLGSLYAFTLRNDMKPQESTTGLDTDELTVSKLTYRPTYDFQLRGFYIESTQSTTDVNYTFNNLRKPIPENLRQNIIQTLGLPAGSVNIIANPAYTIKATPATTPTLQNPTRVYYPLDQAVNLDRQTTSGTFYFWMNDVDATVSTNIIGYGMNLYADLYNKTVSRDVGMVNVYGTKKAHKSGAFYRTNVKLEEELRLNPLARMGYDYIIGNPNSGNAQFARAGAGNASDQHYNDPGAGQLYAAYTGTNPVLSSFQDKTFTVTYTLDRSPSNAPGHTPQIELKYSNLRWNVPDRFDVFSVLPYITSNEGNLDNEYPDLFFVSGILKNGWTENDIMYKNEQEVVRLDGQKKTVRSYYYRKHAQTYKHQTHAFATNTTYAFRFVGTPYATAFRYTEVGRWFNPNTTEPNIPNDEPTHRNEMAINENSRFRIEAKSIGNHYDFKNVSAAQAEEYLKNVIATDDFWTDPKTGFTRNEVVRRDLHVNGDKNGGVVTGGGQRMHFWTRALKDQNTRLVIRRTEGNPGIYFNARTDNKGLYWSVANARMLGGQIGLQGGATGSYVLPWLSVHQPDRK